jgi:hypothetical protein
MPEPAKKAFTGLMPMVAVFTVIVMFTVMEMLGSNLVLTTWPGRRKRHDLRMPANRPASSARVRKPLGSSHHAPDVAESASASRVSSATRSALICAPATAPAAAAAPTCAARSVTLPATHTPGTSVRPVGSAGM